MLTKEEIKILREKNKKRGLNKIQSEEYLNWIDKFISKLEKKSPKLFLEKKEKFK